MPASSRSWARSAIGSTTPCRSFISTLELELVYRAGLRTHEEANLALFRYIDGWYDPHRSQRRLGWRSPDEYEAAYHAQLVVQAVSSTIQSDPMGAR
jgi:putative transposase